ncbi:MAG: hypothetical protein LC105_08335 [Chitinophagales bacterium]|nr:hypothetical protein [Chitinophagales bacterium]
MPEVSVIRSEMNKMLNEVFTSVKQWKEIAQKIGIPRLEQELMQVAFRITNEYFYITIHNLVLL